MRILVLLAGGLALVAVAISLQALSGLAHRLPVEPRSGRSRAVLRTSRHAPPPTSPRRRIGAGGRTGAVRRAPGRSSRAPGALDELEQLEALAERALGGEADATDRLARRAAAAATACGLSADAVAPAAHRDPVELAAALGRIERELGHR